jgi:hypothetical protein
MSRGRPAILVLRIEQGWVYDLNVGGDPEAPTG